MKKTICSLMLAGAGLLGSCNFGPSAERVGLCNERAEDARAFAKEYKIERLETELNSVDCPTAEYGWLDVDVIVEQELKRHCDKLSTEAYELIRKDSFKSMVFGRQGWCELSWRKPYMHRLKSDIRSLQSFINNYEVGENQ